jgi:3-methyladenine DNA glycosylase AlkD
MIEIAQVNKELQRLADADYRLFISRLIPNEAELLGVRMPALRRLAKSLAADADWRGFAAAALPEAASHELVLLQGLVIGYAKGTWDELASLIEAYLPRLRNWAICDSFASGLKISHAYPEPMWQLLRRALATDQPYQLRFVAVMLLNHYLDAEHLTAALALLAQIRHEDYYVKMAVAWAVSAFYLSFPEQTFFFLRQNELDDFSHNKALQKIGESRLCDAATKDLIRQLKR